MVDSVNAVRSSSEPVHRRLNSAAGRHARHALSGYSAGHCEVFYLHAGAALELAIKARLVKHGLVFLAPDRANWFDHYDQLRKNADGTDGKRPFTVDASVALSRLRQLEPKLPAAFSTQVTETLNRRNIAAHLGIGNEPDSAELAGQAASFIRAVNQFLLTDRRRFWGDLFGLAETLVAEELSLVHVRVERLIAASRQLRARLGSGFADYQRSRAPKTEKPPADTALIDCPGCRSTGLLHGIVVDRGGPSPTASNATNDPDNDSDLNDWAWQVDLVLLPETFLCPVCDLTLTGEDELQAARLPDSVPAAFATPSDAIDLDGIDVEASIGSV